MRCTSSARTGRRPKLQCGLARADSIGEGTLDRARRDEKETAGGGCPPDHGARPVKEV